MSSGAVARSVAEPEAAARTDPVDVRVYKFTGKQAFFTIPESWCRECDLYVRTVDRAAERADAPVEVEVVPWVTHLLGALRFGGYHPPVLVVDRTRVAQGEDVPSVDRVVDAIEAAARRHRQGAGA
jgi:hypothetical protein